MDKENQEHAATIKATCLEALEALFDATVIYKETMDTVCNVLANVIGASEEKNHLNLVSLLLAGRGHSLNLYDWAVRNHTLGYLPEGQELDDLVSLTDLNQKNDYHLIYTYSGIFYSGRSIVNKLPNQLDNFVITSKASFDMWNAAVKMQKEHRKLALLS